MSAIQLRRILSIVVVGLIVGAPASRADEQRAKPKAAATPEEAFTRFADAVNSDKFADALPYIAEPGDAAWKAFLGGLKAAEGLGTALDKQFGKADQPDPFLSTENAIKNLKESVYDTQGTIHATTALAKDRVRLTLWTMRQGLGGEKQAIYETLIDAVHAADGWRLEAPPPGPRPVVMKVKRTDKDGTEVEVYMETSPKFDDKGRLQFDDKGRLQFDGKQITPQPFSQRADELRKLKEMYSDLVAKLDELTEAVSAGKYKSRAEAMDSLKNSLHDLQKKYQAR